MKIKLFIMGVDGTLTDGTIYMSGQGKVMKAFDIKDGYGIKHMLPEMGIVPVIITGRPSEIVFRRAQELDIQELYQGVRDKLAVLGKAADKFGVTFDEIAYIGDDINDLPCMELCGFTACPFDAAEEVRGRVTYICQASGGFGAVWECIAQLHRGRV